jgi:hypothetical protein
MKYFFVISLLVLTFTRSTPGKKQPPPFAVALPESQVVDILLWTNSTQTQYLGYDWVNSYCFGRVLGCAVTDQPATAEYSYGEIVFRSGDWLIYATCFGDAPGQIQWLAPCWKPDTRAQVSVAKNMTTLLVGDPGSKQRRWSGHTYTVVSAFNTRTKEVWGQATLDAWRLAVAAMEIARNLKSLSLDEQLAWSAKLSQLQAAGLMNADNLEKFLAEIRDSRPATSQQLAPAAKP